MIADQLDARAARWPEAPLRVLVPRAAAAATCRGEPALYADEPTAGAIRHLREAWAALHMARNARAKARAHAARDRGDAA